MNHKQVLQPVLALLTVPVLFSAGVRAHCPLCSAGAGGAAALASALGIGLVVVGVFVGAFGLATGLWTNSFVDTRYLPAQDRLIALGVYVTIVFPILPLMSEYVPFYLSIAGDYGSVLNRTYLVNTYLVGAIAGGVVTSLTPQFSGWLSERRGNTVPFQGLALTFFLLILTAGILEVVL